MAKSTLSRALTNWVAHTAASVPLRMKPKNPVFLVGCARSGTSILDLPRLSYQFLG
jgi:hypothetical protein